MNTWLSSSDAYANPWTRTRKAHVTPSQSVPGGHTCGSRWSCQELSEGEALGAGGGEAPGPPEEQVRARKVLVNGRPRLLLQAPGWRRVSPGASPGGDHPRMLSSRQAEYQVLPCSRHGPTLRRPEGAAGGGVAFLCREPPLRDGM